MTARLPDGHTADLARHEREQAAAERIHDSSAKQAERDLRDPAELADAIDYFDKGHPVAECLARCFANLDQACRGEQVGRDAITTALNTLRDDLLGRLTEKLYQDYEP